MHLHPQRTTMTHGGRTHNDIGDARRGREETLGIWFLQISLQSPNLLNSRRYVCMSNGMMEFDSFNVPRYNYFVCLVKLVAGFVSLSSVFIHLVLLENDKIVRTLCCCCKVQYCWTDRFVSCSWLFTLLPSWAPGTLRLTGLLRFIQTEKELNAPFSSDNKRMSQIERSRAE